MWPSTVSASPLHPPTHPSRAQCCAAVPARTTEPPLLQARPSGSCRPPCDSRTRRSRAAPPLGRTPRDLLPGSRAAWRSPCCWRSWGPCCCCAAPGGSGTRQARACGQWNGRAAGGPHLSVSPGGGGRRRPRLQRCLSVSATQYSTWQTRSW
jgi:hypothetical protein